MRILVTGASGQVGRELCRQGRASNLDVVATDLPQLDITDAVRVQEFLTETSPDAVFNAAAWTAVDDAEDHEEAVFRINCDGAANIAKACEETGIPLVHYSTDYVFDGEKTDPYCEDDAPSPVNVYGRSKLAAEEAVRNLCEKHLVLRTSSVFSAHGNNFVKTMLRLGQEHTELRVVSDQASKPTSAAELARIALDILSRTDIAWGVYHLAQPEAVSWHGFAKAIFDSVSRKNIGTLVRNIEPIKTADYPTVATRPANSVLDCAKFEECFEVCINNWHGALDTVIEELANGAFFA